MAVEADEEGHRMKVLSLVWFQILPARYGGQKGTALFNEFLGRKADLTCLCSKNNSTTEPASYRVINDLPVSKAQFINPIAWYRILREVKRQQATVLIVEYPYHAIAAVLTKRLLNVKLILHEHNIEFQRFRGFGKAGWQLLHFLEKRLAQAADLVILKTESDQKEACNAFSLPASKTFVLPYGVEIPEAFEKADYKSRLCEQFGIAPHKKIILFAGTLDYEPNAQAIEALYKIVAPKLVQHTPDFHILICGRNRLPLFSYLNEMHHPHITNAGEVADITAYYKGSDLFVNPVYTGGGIQTKSLDALSYSLPLVSFKKQTEGINGAYLAAHLFVANDGHWNDFTSQIVAAMDTPSSSIPRQFFNAYSFEASVARFYGHLQQLIQKEK